MKLRQQILMLKEDKSVLKKFAGELVFVFWAILLAAVSIVLIPIYIYKTEIFKRYFEIAISRFSPIGAVAITGIVLGVWIMIFIGSVGMLWQKICAYTFKNKGV